MSGFWLDTCGPCAGHWCVPSAA